MPVLIIGEKERKQIAELIAYARTHPVSLEIIKAGALPDKNVLELKDRKPGFERPAFENIILPGGYRVAYSIELQPAGLCSHLSISVVGRSEKGKMPSPEAVTMIAAEFGVPSLENCLSVWTEEFDPGEYAVNLIAIYRES